MREVGGAVERIDVPAKLAVEAFAGSLFAVDAVFGERRAEALADKSFAGAVGFGDEVDVAFVLGAHAAMIEVAQQSAGLARDGFRGGKKFGHARVPRHRRAGRCGADRARHLR